MTRELGCLLVTGANGHVGRNLIGRLLDEGHDAGIRAVVRSQRAAALLEPLTRRGPLEVCILDPRDAEALGAAGAGCSHVVHLVGILKESPRARYEEAHEQTTRAVERTAAKSGARRVVYLSILGASADSPNPCLASKARAEAILLEGSVPSVVIRVPMVLGPGEIAAGALRAQACSALVPLVRGGASHEQPIDSADLVEAILRALVAPGVEAACLDLAGPESLPRRELLRRAAALIGRRPRILPVPLTLARLFAGIAERLLRDPPLTRAMLDVLEHDDAVDPEPTCRQLGLELTPLDVTLERCLGEASAS